MAKRRRGPATQRYHDRVAGKYDDIYHDVYWRFHDQLTWEHMRDHLPRNLESRVLDLGCGTGKWGIKLLESGFHVTFVDISAQMLDQARAKLGDSTLARKAEFVHADLMDLSALPEQTFAFAVGMGEPICCADKPPQALAQIRRVLTPDGVLVATIDNRLACVDYYVQAGDPDALNEFLKTGRTHWLTRQRDEQFKLTTYSPDQLRSLLRKTGFETLDMIGKTVLPMRNFRDHLSESVNFKKWIIAERSINRLEASLGRCAHLQFAARVQSGDALPTE